MAMEIPEDSSMLSGILVRRNFNFHLLHPDDLNSEHIFKFPQTQAFTIQSHCLAYTELSNSRLTQRMSVFYDQSNAVLMHNLRQLTSEISVEDAPKSKDPNAPTQILKMFKVGERAAIG